MEDSPLSQSPEKDVFLAFSWLCCNLPCNIWSDHGEVAEVPRVANHIHFLVLHLIHRFCN